MTMNLNPFNTPFFSPVLNLRVPLLILLFGGVLGASAAFAQKEMAANTSTEQPGFYVGTYTMYPGNFQVESSFIFSQTRILNTNLSTLNVPAVLLRYGVSDWLEVRAGTEYNRTIANPPFFSSDQSLSPLLVGVKAQVIQPGKKLPELSLRAHFRIPRTGSWGVGPENLASNIMLISNFPILTDFTGYVNLGIDWNGFSEGPTYQYGFAIERGLSTNLTAYLEAYGFLSVDPSVLDHSYDLGLYYAITPYLQADISGGFGPGSSGRRNSTWFASGGLSFRLVPPRNKP